MTQRLIIHPNAQAEIVEAFNYYESQAPNLGNEFLQAVEESLRGIEQFPSRALLVFEDFRRVLLRRFPFALYYSVLETPDEQRLEVLSCFHTSRDPQSLQKFLRNLSGTQRPANVAEVGLKKVKSKARFDYG